MLAIYKRELRSYFITPIGYVFCGMFLCVSGLLFGYFNLYLPANSSSTVDSSSCLYTYFYFLVWVFAIILPLITMRSLSEERRSRTEQLLMTSPVSIAGMIIGKYLAAVTIYVCTFLVNSINFFFLYLYCTPNTEAIFADLFGLLLLGCAFIAVGIFLSALTENQLIAAISSIGVNAVLLLLNVLADVISVESVRNLLNWLSVLDRYEKILAETFDLTSVVYFISLAALFIFLTVRIYEKRRWS